jgi:hypothetical protein
MSETSRGEDPTSYVAAALAAIRAHNLVYDDEYRPAPCPREASEIYDVIADLLRLAADLGGDYRAVAEAAISQAGWAPEWAAIESRTGRVVAAFVSSDDADRWLTRQTSPERYAIRQQPAVEMARDTTWVPPAANWRSPTWGIS